MSLLWLLLVCRGTKCQLQQVGHITKPACFVGHKQQWTLVKGHSNRL